MDYNCNKYWIEDSDLLTEVEKVRMAEALLDLERRGILQYRNGAWGIAPGVLIEETTDALIAHIGDREEVIE